MSIFTFVEKKMTTEQKKVLNECSLVELREMLRERGLPTSGNKADLVTRLFEADSRLEQGVPARTESREEIRTDTPDEMGSPAEANWELEREREMLQRERERERERAV